MLTLPHTHITYTYIHAQNQTTVQRQLEALQAKQRRQAELCAALRRQNASLKWLLLMCERHPPERAALVRELEEKIAVRPFFVLFFWEWSRRLKCLQCRFPTRACDDDSTHANA